ncbi:hypothetical protein B0A55_03987 [Friedmanniomyces simplex]|uniref:Uncharacterized protein n=1 Tax=Friedmanniomyces simplex TaxID=329884 RepID=A0A4U0XGK2_9PEZI|nr:hypothetical protein B0A55_03987 [Friedmanniomyces simplex]
MSAGRTDRDHSRAMHNGSNTTARDNQAPELRGRSTKRDEQHTHELPTIDKFDPEQLQEAQQGDIHDNKYDNEEDLDVIEDDYEHIPARRIGEGFAQRDGTGSSEDGEIKRSAEDPRRSMPSPTNSDAQHGEDRSTSRGSALFDYDQDDTVDERQMKKLYHESVAQVTDAVEHSKASEKEVAVAKREAALAKKEAAVWKRRAVLASVTLVTVLLFRNRLGSAAKMYGR